MMSRRRFKFDYFTITTREIIASISIIAILLLIGVLISSKIYNFQMDRNEVYNKAIKIDSTDMFKYGMKTNIGNAFVHGDLIAVDTVNYPEIIGEYMYIKRIKERYTQHTRTVTKTRTVNGKTQTYTDTETYWSWDRVGSEEKKCSEISFCGVRFPSNKIILPETEYIDTIKESSYIRYEYYGTGIEFKGTIFTLLKDNTISDDTQFYQDKTIQEAVDMLSIEFWNVLFWILWILFIVVVIFVFFYLENRWLE